jgi:hypothetical protein
MSMNMFEQFFTPDIVGIIQQHKSPSIPKRDQMWAHTRAIYKTRISQVKAMLAGELYCIRLVESPFLGDRAVVLVKVRTYATSYAVLLKLLVEDDDWTSTSVYDMVSETLDSLDLDAGKCVSLVGDNTAYMPTGFSLAVHGGTTIADGLVNKTGTDVPPIVCGARIGGCFAHTLNLTIQAVRDSVRATNMLLTQINSFVFQGGDQRKRVARLKSAIAKVSRFNVKTTRWTPWLRTLDLLLSEWDTLRGALAAETLSAARNSLLESLGETETRIEARACAYLLKDVLWLIQRAQGESCESFAHRELRSLDGVLAEWGAAATTGDDGSPTGALDVIDELLNGEELDEDIQQSIALSIQRAAALALSKIHHGESLVQARITALPFIPRTAVAEHEVGGIGKFAVPAALPETHRHAHLSLVSWTRAKAQYLGYTEFLAKQETADALPAASTFWSREGKGRQAFPDLALVARYWLTFPIGTPDVESDFSEIKAQFPASRDRFQEVNLAAETILKLNKGVK